MLLAITRIYFIHLHSLKHFICLKHKYSSYKYQTKIDIAWLHRFKQPIDHTTNRITNYVRVLYMQ